MSAMRHSTKDDERGELPRCAACGKVTGEGVLRERDPEEGELSFCDARCREDWRTRMDAEGEPDGDARAA